MNQVLCNKVGHEGQPIFAVCIDTECENQRPCCGICMFEDHRTHFQSIQKLEQIKCQFGIKKHPLLELVDEVRNNINQKLNVIEKNIKMIEVPIYPDEINLTNINRLGQSISKCQKYDSNTLKEKLIEISQNISNNLDEYLNRVKLENQQINEKKAEKELKIKQQKERELQEQKEGELQKQKEIELQEQKEYEIQSKKEISEEYRTKGDEAYTQQKYELAIEKYDFSLNCNNRNDLSWNNKGMALQSLNREQDAILCFERAIEINPQSIYYCNKAHSLFSQNKLVKALEVVNKALEINPKNSDSWNQKGLILSQQNYKEEALECLMKAIQFEESDHKFFNAGCVLEELGRKDEAISYYYQALEYNPQNYEAQKKVQKLEQF